MSNKKPGRKIGSIPWNKGKKEIRPEVIEKLRESHLGQTSWNKGNVGYRAGIRRTPIGFKHAEETKKKMSESRLGDKAYQWKGGLPECKECDKTLSTRNGKTGLCIDCYKHPSGDKSHMWRGGITEKNKLDRSKFGQQLQKKVLERDNYTCQMCSKTECALQVDHIQPWAEYVELRFDINNCRTLCMDCHYLITYGKKKPDEIKTWGRNFYSIKGQK